MAVIRDRFGGMVALVTGAGSGIGAAVVARLTEYGAVVVAADVDGDSVNRVAARLQGVEAETVDVADSAAVDALFVRVMARHRRLDVIVHSAGVDDPDAKRAAAEAAEVGRPLSVTVDLPDSAWRRVLTVNLDGTFHVVVAGGVEVMSAVPIMSPALLAAEHGMAFPFDSVGWKERYGDEEVSQFHGAELIAEKWDVSRADMEAFALSSHQRATAARQAGHFAAEIAPGFGVDADEGPRPGTTLEKMATLAPLRDGGRLTAAVSSQISDGAAALLMASADAVERLGVTPLARVHTMAVVGSDPILMLTGPIPATAAALDRAGLALADIDLFEVNEAFASVVLAWRKETGASLERTNVSGGAIALGHPLGASGARLMTTLVHALRRTGGRYGLQTMCEGGGMANATIVERV